MDVAVLRRYLQPSPTLRWHPWAPLVVIVAALGFTFAFGVKVGSHAAQKINVNPWWSQAFLAKVRIADDQQGGIRGVMWDAKAIDNAVKERVLAREHPRTRLARIRDHVESLVVFGREWPDSTDQIDHAMRDIAEWRLAHFSGDAPAWRATAAYCDSPFAPYLPADVASQWEGAAADYSKFLGRTVTASQLAPKVPGGHCKGREDS